MLLQILALADDARGYVGADLVALCSEAAMSALKSTVASSQNPPCVSLDDFIRAQSIVRPSALRELSFQPPKVNYSFLMAARL